MIQLHGSREDYTLVNLAEQGSTGTAIFLKGETNNELIGNITTASGLSLDADYFRFVDAPAAGASLGLTYPLASQIAKIALMQS